MLTNKDLNALKEFCEKSHLPILKELAIEAFDELLTLREAVAPKMAEVDEQFGGASARLGLLAPSRTREECQSDIERCYSLTRTAILACEVQKQRADGAEARYEKQIEITYEAKAVVSRMQKEKHNYDGFANQRFTEDKEKIDSLTAELSAIRDAGDEEVEKLTNEIQYQLRTADILKLRDIAIARGQKLWERDAETKLLISRNEELRDLLTSARAIAERKGVDTAWERFSQRLADAGIGSVTAKVFKVLPSDLEVSNGE